ncbi:UDP-glucose:glycoprotein glucosyltransferase 2 isoform X1 [Xiphias gladius]|uniref:UDP-glucose:glycoprotein glucosyltransferase 2 isoform X1 n=1 Tax=Xiphias gladius TaxID=8245 RepID=UPI001A97FD02|nr:UDP-glucose:glycoprotein glucosyltransferase 2 isoform X1 [Xiphias gladius]XP_040003704.1 UDP-glucose:glycoprotein glucosyltransferase 2 isoform X1 [Xiphias gladius]XP_040003705.1 UDP-glucose:glycoprotein glucosyltransferase 2 isoform X1 [Xiphias gladius]XP_040003706.1 UDP-glucose:glycoprotein glucosyltransferase 2 isoform X1 [Xiphias gladius]XP_040003708.1 UDP-glucose:glycoprotein glucosyltransferase 2 isoform X1 [Xiphias gladius]
MRTIIVLSLLLVNIHRTISAPKGVTASLRAKWSMTPFLLETSEFIGEDGNEKFWQFVDTVKELTVYKQGESVRSYYNLIIKKAGQFLTDLQVNLLKFALALRSYSPAVHASQQIARDEPPPEACPAFVSIHGQHSCSTKDIKKLLKAAAGRPKPYLYKNDRTYLGVNKTDVPVVILYAEIGTKKFTSFHKVLSEKAQQGTLIYVLRHFVADPKPQKMLLSGYGVELAIKSTEYKAVDDTKVKDSKTAINTEDDDNDEVQGFFFGTLKKSHPELQENLVELRKHLLESTNDMAPLKVWEMQDLSFQAAARIMSIPKFDALKLMRDLSQNFPSKARSLTRVAVKQEMRKEIEENQKHLSETIGVHPGDGEIFINGLHIDLDIQNPFSILDILRGEARVLEGLHNLGIKGEHQGKLLRLPVNAVDDSYALDIRHPSIMWINDIENDPMYRSWPTGVQELLRATFPGVIRQIRRNFFNLVLFLDPVQEESVELVKLAELFYKHKIPLRIGFVFVVNTKDEIDGFSDAGVGFYRLLNYIADEYDLSQALMSMVSLYNKVDVGEKLSVDTLSAYLKRKFPKASPERILGVESEYDDKRKDGALFYKKTGLGALPLALFNGVPLSPDEMDPDELETIILQRIMDTTTTFQRAVFMGQLTEGSDVVDYLMEQANVVPRMNPLILSTDRKYLDFTAKPVVDDWEDTTMFSYLDARDKTAVVAKRMKYFTNSDEDGMSTVTMWIAGDLERVSGRKLLLNALKHVQNASPGVRVGVIDNPSGKPSEDNTVLYRAIWASFLTQKKKAALEFVQKLLKEESSQLLQQGTKMKDLLMQEMDEDAFEKKFNTLEVDFIRSQQLFCRDVLKLSPGERGVISNGRILGPFEEQEEFTVEDFHLLEKITRSGSAEKVKAKVKQMGMKPKHASDLVMKVDALLTAAPKGEVRRDVHFIKDSHSILHLSPRENEVFYDVVAIVDPLTRQAQKMSPLLIVLSQVVNVRLQVFMNCRAKLSEMPLKSFYRFVLESDVTFLANDTVSPGPVAHFMELPESPLLTLNMITPESWIVQAVRSPHDLDNIHLQEVSRVVTAEYELEHLLLEGHCFDLSTGQPPRGLQFTLGMRRDPLMYDTIVMANLGYFQLKANPGAWILRLREGRSEDIYQVLTHDGTDSPVDAGDVIVVLNSFHSKIIKVRVQKKAEKINEDLLSETNESKGIWDSIASITGGGSKKDDGEKKREDVLNIFSVASGHLYERFLRIMMLSVLRHTKTPVKFWFLKNYLSPSFKETISHMAESYGFQYELVQYKWPRWLHQQTEKQRIIWGYKILFLDVLFPLAVDKIIFVDADQIVRADLKELRDLDLKGAPYGYTPFCDSRKEMEGYRFWKTGYWASHLGHRKYHISALYVVDLKKFRKIAAGDRLRGQYQALSQDPNSLSNLDQDLPNNMIHQVAIRSLPQEWLWCETWCDDASKVTAKTIDLCNNPKTKEPKLMAAARIVPEWVEYDNEIKQLLRRVQEQGDTAKEKQTPSTSQQKKVDNLRDEL